MQSIDRRRFLKLAGAGSALAATAGLPVVALRALDSGKTVSFRAEAGLPAKPLPAYATKVVEGTVDLSRGTGTVTSRMLAGHPGDLSDIALPGMTQVISITSVSDLGTELQMEGVIQDRSQLLPGESAQVRLVLDRIAHVMRTTFAGQDVELALALR
jgi:hypothetical protein